MLRRVLFVAVAVGVSALPVLAEVSKNPQSARKGAYEADPNHTIVTFCTSHMDISTYCGRFKKLTAKLTFNGAQPDRSTLSATIDLNSVDTTSDELNNKLRKELFKTDKNPTATFTSTAVAVTGTAEGTVTGDLTINGTTKPVTLRTKYNGGQAFPFGDKYQLGFSAEGTFKRSDFGLTDMVGAQFAGDEVTLHIDAEFLSSN
jgi:polyisoprenoid-binding protein YceI